MDQFLLKICAYIQINSAACNNAILGLYTNSNVQKEYNASKSFSDSRLKYYVDENKTVVYTGVILGSGYDMYQKREIKLSTPLRPLCDSLSVDLKPNSVDSFSANWKWEF